MSHLSIRKVSKFGR